MPLALGWFAAGGREEAGLREKKEARHWSRLLSWHSRWVTLSWWCYFGSSQDDCWGHRPDACRRTFSRGRNLESGVFFFLCWHLTT